MKRLAVMLTALLATACSAPFSPVAGTVTVVGDLQPARKLLGASNVVPYTLDRVTRIEAWGTDLTAGGQATNLGAMVPPFEEVQLYNLQPRHEYRVTLKAFIGDEAVSEDEGSVTAFDTKAAIGTGMATEKVRVPGFNLAFRSQAWTGSAGGALAVQTGLKDKGADVRFTLPSPSVEQVLRLYSGSYASPDFPEGPVWNEYDPPRMYFHNATEQIPLSTTSSRTVVGDMTITITGTYSFTIERNGQTMSFTPYEDPNDRPIDEPHDGPPDDMPYIPGECNDCF